MVEIFSLTLKTNRIEPMAQFYQCLMPQMKMKQVKVGGQCFVGQSGNVEFVLFPEATTSNECGPKLQFSFKISGIEKVAKAMSQVQGAQLLMDVSDVPEGKMAILLDPDGNSVQVIES